MFGIAVRDLMKHLAAAPVDLPPFLQVHGPRGRLRARHRVPEETLWADVLEHEAGADAELVILVKAVEHAADAFTASAHPCGEERCPQLDDAEMPVIGHAGECCDNEDDHGASEQMLQDAVRLSAADVAGRAASTSASGLQISYYGLVAQHRQRASADGCYLVKTVRHSDPTCRCMHYSVMHICQGAPLAEQALAHWL